MNTTHLSNTRKVQRAVTKYLKAQGIKAVNSSSKTQNGWVTTIKCVKLNKSKLTTLECHTGRLISVTTKGSC